MYKVRYKNKIYLVKAKDSDMAVKKVKEAIGNEKDVELNDDRLSPMTYRKLKELGYGPNDWKNLTQEKANEIVASHAQGGTNNAAKQANTQTNTQTKSTPSSNASKSTSTSTQSKQSYESSFTPQQMNLATKVWGSNKDEVLGKLKEFVDEGVMSGKFTGSGFKLDYEGDIFQASYLPNGGVVISSGDSFYDEDAQERTSDIDPNKNIDVKVLNNFSELGAYFAKKGYTPVYYEDDTTIDERHAYEQAFWKHN